MTQYKVHKLRAIKREVKIVKNNMVRKLEEKVVCYLDTPPRIHLDSMGKGNAKINRHRIHLTPEIQTRERIPIEKHKITGGKCLKKTMHVDGPRDGPFDTGVVYSTSDVQIR